MRRADARPVLLVRFARELGWIELYDPFERAWLQIRMADALPIWRRWAFEEKRARQAARAAERPAF